MPTNYKQKDKIRELTFGITDGLSSVLLYFLYVTVYIGARPGSRGAFDKSDYLLTKFDGAKLRRAMYNLTKQGLIMPPKKNSLMPVKITKLGISKAESSLSLVSNNRRWNGSLYLINYDIPIKANWKRVMFQKLLLKHKCAMLQNSVYITPYNPSTIIREFSNKYSLPGEILISTLDIKSTFQTAPEVRRVLWKVFQLEKLNLRYGQFLDSYAGLSPESIQNKKLVLSITLQYASIKKDDPQLPPELLLEGYLGFEASELFHKLITHKTDL